MEAIKVVAFDTGGTILDWHGGLVAVLRECGARCGVERDWHAFANEYRRRSLERMLGALDPGSTSTTCIARSLTRFSTKIAA